MKTGDLEMMCDVKLLLACCKYLYIRQLIAMLLMIAIISSSALLGGSTADMAHASRHEPSNIIKTPQLKPQRDSTTVSNNSLAISLEDRAKLGDQMSVGSNSSISGRPVINLSLLDERPSKDDRLNKQLKRHQYSVSLSNSTQLESNSTQKLVQLTRRHNGTSSADLETSDSRSRPQVKSRSDEMDDYESSNSNADDTDSPSMDDETYIDGASSNRREKKVMRELTKILSKGMSGATDQVRVETLENLKKRQKERKAIKESRAKLFEDLLTTAINNHSEKLKKSRRHNQYKDSNSNLKSAASSASNLPPNSNLDPEMASDAETVLQHLQGLSTAIDGHSPSSSNSNSGSYGSSSNLDQSEPSSEPEPEDATGPSESSIEANEPEVAADEKPVKAKSSSSSSSFNSVTSERPIVRQFKKIKNQISQRRKQLDQIKKLFNIELALNPKDGSLISKQVGSSPVKTKVRQQQTSTPEPEDLIDYTQDSDGPASNKRTRPAGRVNGYKARELLAYLRENPEILASVMAELTIDADPTTPTNNGRSSNAVGGRDEGSYAAPGDYGADLNIESLSTRKTFHQAPPRLTHTDTDQSPWHQAPVLLSASTGRRGSSSRVVHEFESIVRPPKYWSRSGYANHLAGTNFLRPARSRSAESMLLETLRERQLLNLARLDLVLAERHAATAANRSSFFGQTSANYSQQSKPQNRSDHADPYQRSGHDYEPEAGKRNLTGASYKSANSRPEDEVTHHFMVINPNSNDSAPSGRSSGDFLNNIQPGQSQDQQGQDMRASNGSGGQTGNSNGNQQYSTAGSNTNQNGSTTRDKHSPNTLKRFRDWRDVSQSEASSWQYDKTNNPNITWTPYDLTTGGSSSLAMESQSLRVPSTPFMNYRAQQPAASSRSGNYTLPPINLSHMQLDQLNGQQSAHASSQTLPQNQMFTNIMDQPQAQSQQQQQQQQQQHQQQASGDNSLASSMFMTRSSATGEPDLSTVKVGGVQDEASKTASSGSSSASELNKREPSHVEDASRRAPADVEEAPSSRSSPVNYFSAYKQEMPIKGRKKARSNKTDRKSGSSKGNQRQKSQRDDPKMAESPEMDDMGAMWA